jgi:hypothetical protein
MALRMRAVFSLQLISLHWFAHILPALVIEALSDWDAPETPVHPDSTKTCQAVHGARNEMACRGFDRVPDIALAARWPRRRSEQVVEYEMNAHGSAPAVSLTGALGGT